MYGKNYFQEQCKRLGVDKRLARKIGIKLAPLLERATEKDPLFNKKLLEYRKEMVRYRLENILLIDRLFFDKIRGELELEPREISLLF